MWVWYQENQPNLKIRVKIFLKCSLWYIAAKLENIWTKIFLQEVHQESCGWNIICQILILPIWLVTPPCFLVKLSQILQKVIVFFPERREEIKISFWHIWIAQWLKFFRSTAYFFILTIIRRKRGVKLGRKVLTLSPFLFHKYSNPSKKFQTVFLFARVLPLLRISAILDHIWRVRTQKTSQKGQFRGCWTVRKILDIFNLTTTNAILMKLTTIMYFHESLNGKALKVRNSFFGLI